jgi:hypothetical protein
MEPRFGCDFSQVRVHSGSAAAESARAVNALAYTVGRDVVFGAGQYAPGITGRRLLAHELTHVVQQSETAAPARSIAVASASSAMEEEAEAVAGRIAAGGLAPPLVNRNRAPALMRKLKAHRPAEPIPNTTGQGPVQTNAEAVESYLRTLAPQGDCTVDRSSGEVRLATGFCPGVLGGLLQGARSGYRIGHTIGSVGGRIPLFGPIFGAIGGAIGGLIGAVGGLFGANISRAASSQRPAGSQCICDFVHSRGETTTIEVTDQERPAGAATWVRVPSPNSQTEWGTTTMSGRLEVNPPWLILAHELCGHAWLDRHTRGGEGEEGRPEDQAPLVSRDPQTGALQVAEREGPDGPWRQPSAGQFLRHGRSVERENVIRAEHGLEARGYRLRDPYCGESFARARGAPNQVNWQETRDPFSARTFLEQCEFLRSQLPESRLRRYEIYERIPES